MTRAPWLFCFFIATASALTIGAHCQELKQASSEKDFSSELPRIAPLTPTDALKSFEVAPGFKIDLVAAEPLVVDPVAFCFNANGNLFVVEMIDYSERENDFLGRIAMLTDTDQDGRMDQRSMFVEKLSWPTAIHPWKDGVIVIAPPMMVWYRDTDGDGRSDTSETWCEGFGRTNVQGMANSLRWSVEGYIVGSTSSSGASLKGKVIHQDSLELRGRDFRIDPVQMRIDAVSGGGQHGAAFNRWGDRFVTSNSNHLQQIIDLDAWLSERSVGSLPITTKRSIAEDGPQAEVFRKSPVEPWRVVRTRLRVSGEVPGAVEGGGRAAGYFTGATGTWIMDESAGFGVPGFDTAFACDVGSNLIHRKKLEGKDLFWTASRIDNQSEFVRSSDIWFRPAQLGDGPDGALYIADMYREVIEHPQSLPPVIKKHLDLNSGNDRGRIWRVRRDAPQEVRSLKKSGNESNAPIAKLDNQGLVSQLASPISWRRLMASQLLVERNALDVIPAIKNLVKDPVAPPTQILALHLLARLGALDSEPLLSALTSTNSQLNRHAISLICKTQQTELIASSSFPIGELLARADDRLQLELAMAAVHLPTERSIAFLRRLMPLAANPTTRSVIIAAAGMKSWSLIVENLQGDETKLDPVAEKLWIADLLPHWCQQLNDSKVSADDKNALRDGLREFVSSDLARSSDRADFWADAIAKLSTQKASDLFLQCWQPEKRREWEERIRSSLDRSNEKNIDPKRRIAWLRFGSDTQRSQWLDRALAANSTERDPSGIIDACLWADAKSTTSALVDRFFGLTPKLQEPILLALVSHPEAVISLASAVETKKITIPQIPPTVRQRMTNHPVSATRKRFVDLLAATTTTDKQLQDVIEQYRRTLDASANLPSDSIAWERGQATFQKNCAACHRIGKDGQDVGPPLKSLHEKSPEQLLISVLDPNREVDPRFQAYSILIDDGRVLTGVIREESGSQIVLAESGGKLATIARGEIEQVKGNGTSLMPTGLQQQISPEAMAELIAWLRSVRDQ